MDSDKFINTTKNHPIKNIEDENNFFLQSDVISVGMSASEPIRHLNDYDSNILKEGAYRDVKDDVFKLEYKITRLEEELKSIDNKIQLALEVYDNAEADSLKSKRLQLQNDLTALLESYKEASISAKISGDITSKIRDRFIKVQDMLVSVSEAFISKLPGKLSSFIEIKNSLVKLENINKSVDELMTRSYPYGESTDKYEQLSKYIARANAIQTEISKFIK